MTCIYCGGDTYVVDTRHPDVAMNTRRRKCLCCGKNSFTVEIDEDEYNKLTGENKHGLHRKEKHKDFWI